MPTQLSKGTTFAENSSGNTAADLNNLVDDGTILPGAIGEQTQTAPIDADLFLYRRNSTSDLRKCSLTQIANALPTDDIAATPSLRRLGTTSVKAAAGNDTRFPASVTGLRLGAGAGSADAAANPKDVDFPPVTLTGAPTAIDWDAGSVFVDDLSVNKTYTWSNRRVGRTIILIFKLNGKTATLPVGTAVASVGSGTTFWYVQVTYSALGTIGTGMLI